MDSQILREVISMWGWKKTHLARALGYDVRTLARWEESGTTLPPVVTAWVNKLPALPSVAPSYSPDPAGLEQFMLDGSYTINEVAHMTHSSYVAVFKWLHHYTDMPAGVKAWLKAGGPSNWLWWPPGYQSLSGTLSGKPCRPAPLWSGKIGTHLEKYPSASLYGAGWRWFRVGGPRSGRARLAQKTGRNPQKFPVGRPKRAG